MLCDCKDDTDRHKSTQWISPACSSRRIIIFVEVTGWKQSTRTRLITAAVMSRARWGLFFKSWKGGFFHRRMFSFFRGCGKTFVLMDIGQAHPPFSMDSGSVQMFLFLKGRAIQILSRAVLSEEGRLIMNRASGIVVEKK